MIEETRSTYTMHIDSETQKVIDEVMTKLKAQESLFTVNKSKVITALLKLGAREFKQANYDLSRLNK